MSKSIKPTAADIEKLKAEFLEAIENGKFSNGKVSFTSTLGQTDKKAVIYFTEMAWLKMTTLIREFSKEIGWHGVCYRLPDVDNEFLITDIIVPPQEVTGVTVTTDQESYQKWLYSYEDDIFNNIRMQGHSHVNMSTSPSGVDNELYDSILSQLDGDSFYIFQIWNKSLQKTIMIYDMQNNVYYDTPDITVEVVKGEYGLDEFLQTAKDMVKEHTYQQTNKSAKNASTKQTGNTNKTKDNTNCNNNAWYGRASFYDDGWDDYDDFQYPSTFKNVRKYYGG